MESTSAEYIDPTKLAYASWVFCVLVFIYTILQTTILFIATARRRHWHMQLHQVRIQDRVADTKAVISTSPDEPSASLIPLTPLVDGKDKIDDLVAFVRPKVGWKSAYVAVQGRRTGLRELFL